MLYCIGGCCCAQCLGSIEVAGTGLLSSLLRLLLPGSHVLVHQAKLVGWTN
jgi:hypothetical protein